MITPNAKCVVNGPKVNEVITALNPLLDMSIIVGDGAEPRIQYGGGGVQIVLPAAGENANEQLDVVDSNNTASTRWFITSSSQGGSSESSSTGSPTDQSYPSPQAAKRESLGGSGGMPPDREKLGGGGAPTGGNTSAGSSNMLQSAGQAGQPGGPALFGEGTPPDLSSKEMKVPTTDVGDGKQFVAAKDLQAAGITGIEGAKKHIRGE